MQLGFVIDHSRCIGCHACTVACKAENDVPVGSFRTWVKYTERGSFPEVRRSFAVLRCNQCSDAPCVEICPVRALHKRPDGIVDVDGGACIGCKACMQGCPYDALYLNDATGTAEKCHFCAHRVEVGLAPSCAVVCPTEAIVPGDFDDPESAVSRLRGRHDLRARKVEAGTGPNVLYRDVDAAGVDPLATDGSGGYLWANRLTGAHLEAEQLDAVLEAAETRARTTYDVEHPALWGGKVTGYLFAKSLAAGLLLAPALVLLPRGEVRPGPLVWTGAAALVALLVTTVLLIGDLKRPGRFLFILTRPNWRSWLARGSLVLMGYGAVLTAWVVAMLPGSRAPASVLGALTGGGAVLAVLTACYTGWLFAQARGRVLWMRRGLWLHLVAQAIAAGAASLVAAAFLLPSPPPVAPGLLRWVLLGALAAHAVFVLTEGWMAPAGREAEYRRAVRLLTRGPFARRHWLVGVAAGIVFPVLLLAVPRGEATWMAAAALALVGLWVEEDLLVRAGQALRIS